MSKTIGVGFEKQDDVFQISITFYKKGTNQKRNTNK